MSQFNSWIHNLVAVAFASYRYGRHMAMRKLLAFVEVVCALLQVVIFPYAVALLGIMLMEHRSLYVLIALGFDTFVYFYDTSLRDLELQSWNKRGSGTDKFVKSKKASFPFQNLLELTVYCNYYKDSPLLLRKWSKTNLTIPQANSTMDILSISPTRHTRFTAPESPIGPPSPRRERFQGSISPSVPTAADGDIVSEIRRLIRTLDLNTVSRKQIRMMLAKTFGQEMENLGRRNMINWWIDMVLREEENYYLNTSI
ncbi:hypothetical protein HDU67_001658 [Dinochytrium kinnereticum]|nr:hypothetical protein HDU67_001658 [Dinochytrium kinnereticum]